MFGGGGGGGAASQLPCSSTASLRGESGGEDVLPSLAVADGVEIISEGSSSFVEGLFGGGSERCREKRASVMAR